MKLDDLIDNPEFCFNVKFRVVKYTPTKDDVDHVDVLYESESEPSENPWPFELLYANISAINQDPDTGVIDIEIY